MCRGLYAAGTLLISAGAFHGGDERIVQETMSAFVAKTENAPLFPRNRKEVIASSLPCRNPGLSHGTSSKKSLQRTAERHGL
jgi:hypothetical protein